MSTILMIYTSHSKLGDTDQQTGWYLPEAAHPYAEFTKAGLTVEMASPKGGEAPLDAGSVDASKEDAVSMAFNEDPKLTALWKNTKKLSDCKSSDYAAIFVVGGFGVMWDLPDDKDMIRLAEETYAAGNVVSAVCHGPAALVNVKGPDGEFLAKGKKVSAFTNAEEDAVQRRDVVPFTNEDRYNAIGATFVDGGVFQECVSVNDNFITGQNPPSAGATALAVIKALKK
jgi:putative intracellular protease/amidase